MLTFGAFKSGRSSSSNWSLDTLRTLGSRDVAGMRTYEQILLSCFGYSGIIQEIHTSELEVSVGSEDEA